MWMTRITRLSAGTPPPYICVQSPSSPDEVQQRVDHERVEQRDPGERNEQLVDGGAKRWSFQEDERDAIAPGGDSPQCRQHDHDLLGVSEFDRVEGT